jgi:hypothetical protein
MSHFIVWGKWADGAHIANPIAPLRYLTKCEAQGLFVVTLDPPSSCLISDFRYEDQVKNKAQVLRYGICRGRVNLFKLLKQKEIIKPGDVIGIDYTLMTFAQCIYLWDQFPEPDNDFEL